MMTTAKTCSARLGILTTALCLIATGSVGAQDIEEGQRLLNDFADNVQTLSARFEQSLVDVNDEVIETSSGTVDIQRPGRFRWAYSEPYEQMLIADGHNVWSYDPDLAQVTVKSQARVLRNTPALLLGGSDRVLDDFEYVGSFEDRGTVWVRLRPKNTDNGFSKVELGFREGTLSRMIFDSIKVMAWLSD